MLSSPNERLGACFTINMALKRHWAARQQQLGMRIGQDLKFQVFCESAGGTGLCGRAFSKSQREERHYLELESEIGLLIA